MVDLFLASSIHGQCFDSRPVFLNGIPRPVQSLCQHKLMCRNPVLYQIPVCFWAKSPRCLAEFSFCCSLFPIFPGGMLTVHCRMLNVSYWNHNRPSKTRFPSKTQILPNENTKVCRLEVKLLIRSNIFPPNRPFVPGHFTFFGLKNRPPLPTAPHGPKHGGCRLIVRQRGPPGEDRDGFSGISRSEN